MNVKRAVCDIIRDDGHSNLANRIFTRAITALIIVNVTMVVLDLLYVIPGRWEAAFHALEAVTVAIFTIEYAMRLWIADLLYPQVKPGVARLRYARSPMALVDMLAILPFYLPFALPINAVVLRLLRLVRLLRIMKLTRYSDAKTSKVVLESIKEAFVLIDAEHNFLTANEAANKMFPAIREMKKYAPITDVTNWPEQLTRIAEQTAEDSAQFVMGEDCHYKANISKIYDREKLLRYIILIQDITQVVRFERAEKERIATELAMAAKIQASMLPRRFPDRDEFDIYALMHPAKEVGGDFYDFFYISADKLAVVMADVSGKGMPAALFMANAKTQLKSTAQYGAALPEVMETVNNLLCEGNDECMFVTIFFGVLDIPTGRFVYVNAGHDVPLVRRGDAFEWLPTNPGLMAGFMADSKFVQDEIELHRGDVLLLYTDGVTEAENLDKEQLTTGRLIEIANTQEHVTAKDMLGDIRRHIDIFAEGAEQSDDITMLALRVC